MTKPFFNGIVRRERISLAREWDWMVAVIAANESLTEAIDVRMAAGVAVTVDPNRTNGYLVVYASHEEAGVYRPVRDKDNTLLMVTATAGAIIVLPAEVFPLGWIKLGSCSSAGVLLAEPARREHTIHVKP
jgi:hypothetical protein